MVGSFRKWIHLVRSLPFSSYVTPRLAVVVSCDEAVGCGVNITLGKTVGLKHLSLPRYDGIDLVVAQLTVAFGGETPQPRPWIAVCVHCDLFHTGTLRDLV